MGNLANDPPNKLILELNPMIFVGMVPDPRKMVQESEDRIQGLEQLAQEYFPIDISIYIGFQKYIVYKNIYIYFICEL
jgi:hypothetical protein